MTSRITIAASIVLVLAVAACSAEVSFGGSPNPSAFAEALIEGDIAEQSGFDSLDASCGEAPNDEVGATFDCEAVTDTDETLELVAEIDGEDSVNVQTTNLVTADDVPSLVERSVALLEENAGRPLGVENFDCGTGPYVGEDASVTVPCELTDPANGDVFDAEVTVNDLDGEDPNVDVVVADTPR